MVAFENLWVGLASAAIGSAVAALSGFYFGREKTRNSTLKLLVEQTLQSAASTHALAEQDGELAQLAQFGHVTLESVHILDFKNIANLEIDLSGRGELGGNWTCIAGVNGAGKSSIMQAICLVLLGERLIPEIGAERLRKMWRRTAKGDLPPRITAKCRVGGNVHELFVAFSEDGIDRSALARHPDYGVMNRIWRGLQEQVVLSFGATRNMSDYNDRRYASSSRQVQRQMTLFDPLTQIANIDMLLQGGPGSAPVLATLATLLSRVLPETSIGKIRAEATLRILRDGTSLETIDLPDGFRSTIAWLADLCATWHQVTGLQKGGDPAELSGIVLIDEIDLHLHASLQRDLVPALRRALPKVQFIATTHSPLVLSSFDRRELVILDRDAKRGVRQLDRQIFGMSMDEIYQWLMGTRPESSVIEEMLRNSDPDAALMLAQTPSTNEPEAAEKLARRKAFLKRVKAQSDIDEA